MVKADKNSSYRVTATACLRVMCSISARGTLSVQASEGQNTYKLHNRYTLINDMYKGGKSALFSFILFIYKLSVISITHYQFFHSLIISAR